MPTENRSSSNHGTRTFTLDSLTAALEQVQALHEISADLIAENVFGQPAQQGKGESAAWRGINDLGEVVTEWIDGVPPPSMTDLLGNPASFARIEQAYTYADPTQVARLELDIEQLRFSLTMNDCASVEDDGVRDENRELRAQLAEAQALLLELEGDHTLMLQMGASEFGPKECKTLRARLAKLRTYLRANVLFAAETLAALSASAEPSAPVCNRCQGKGLYTLNGLCPKCGVSQFVAYKLSAPVERDGMTCMVDAAMAEMSNIHPPLKRSDCERLIRAALVGKA